MSELTIEWLNDSPVLLENGVPQARLDIEWMDEGQPPLVLYPGDPDVLEFDGAPIVIAGGAAHYSFTQTAPAATWTWTHNLNTRPPVLLFPDDSPTEAVFTDVTYPDLNTVVIEWPAPTSGKAYI